MLEKMGNDLREGLRLADEAHQILQRQLDHPEDPRIHKVVNKALKDAGLENYVPDVEIYWDAPRYDDSLDEIVGARAVFRLSIRGIEEGDYLKIKRALRPLKIGKALDHAEPDAIEYEVELN